MQQHIHGDYVITGIKNAFNSKTSWWISKRDHTIACYCFSTNTPPSSKPSSPLTPDTSVLADIKAAFGYGPDYNIVRWETAYERDQGLSTIAHTDLTLEEALSIFADEIKQYPSVEVQSGESAICIGGRDADVSTPEWLCLQKQAKAKGVTVGNNELTYQLQNIDGYINMYEDYLSIHSERGKK